MKDTETGLTTEGVLLEDLEVPGAVLCPRLDDAGVMLTIQHVAKHHANFWNSPDLASGALGVKPHNGPWYQPGWGDDIAAYWPLFIKKWETRDARRARELPPEAFAAGEAIMHSFAWIQDELSKKPHTFNHGDVKPPNMFMMPNSVPAFIDWQYTAVGKGCQDILFFLIEGYTIEECRRLEPLAMKHYHAALCTYGVQDYSFADLQRDWKLAAMHFPFYVPAGRAVRPSARPPDVAEVSVGRTPAPRGARRRRVSTETTARVREVRGRARRWPCGSARRPTSRSSTRTSPAATCRGPSTASSGTTPTSSSRPRRRSSASRPTPGRRRARRPSRCSPSSATRAQRSSS